MCAHHLAFVVFIVLVDGRRSHFLTVACLCVSADRNAAERGRNKRDSQ